MHFFRKEIDSRHLALSVHSVGAWGLPPSCGVYRSARRGTTPLVPAALRSLIDMYRVNEGLSYTTTEKYAVSEHGSAGHPYPGGSGREVHEPRRGGSGEGRLNMIAWRGVSSIQDSLCSAEIR